MASMREKRNAHRILVGKINERDHLNDLDVDGTIIQEILNKYDGSGVTDLAQDRGKCWKLANSAMTLRFPQNVWNFSTR